MRPIIGHGIEPDLRSNIANLGKSCQVMRQYELLLKCYYNIHTSRFTVGNEKVTRKSAKGF